MILRKMSEARKRGLAGRATRLRPEDCGKPMFAASNIEYEMAERTRAITYGGMGLSQKLVQERGLARAIDSRRNLLKLYAPYHESDHVLNIAYNALCEGRCLEDIELRRNDETFLNALGTERIPDPTTAGDFCRRFLSAESIEQLQNAIDEARLKVWSRQPERFFEQAIIDMDGHLVETTGKCTQGMDIAYDGTWGYHVLLVSLANTREVLRLVNRPGNRPSHEGAAAQCDRVIALCLRAGFQRILLRGDTDFSQTKHLDRWDKAGVKFHFGYDSKKNLVEIADNLPKNAWQKLTRPARYQVMTSERERPDKVKDTIVRKREFDILRLKSEEVAEFEYRPTECTKSYRMIVVRKNISVEKGKKRLSDKIVYFFYLTNDQESTPAEVVFSCNDRSHQENLIEQLSNGPRALRAPLDNLFSNWAYMVMSGLAWTLKAWWALWLPEKGRWAEKFRKQKDRVLRMEFRSFINYFMKIPCQIVRTGRRLVYRLLNWNPLLSVFRRLANELNC